MHEHLHTLDEYDLPKDTSCISEVVLVLALETAGVGPGIAVLEPVYCI